MSEHAQLYGMHMLRFVCSTANLNVGQFVTNDTSGNPMRLPRGFMVDDGFVHATPGTTPSGGIDVGFSGGDIDTFIAGFTLSSAGSGYVSQFGVGLDGSGNVSGIGLANTGDSGHLLQVTQVSSNETTGSTVTITVIGHYEF